MIPDIRTAVTTLTAIAGVAQKAGNIELYSQILALQGMLVELNSQNAALVQSNADLGRDLADIRRSVKEREEMTFDSNVYWRTAPDGQRDGPFCPKCFDGENKPVRLMVRAEDYYWRCLVCGAAVAKPGADPYARGVRTEYDMFP